MTNNHFSLENGRFQWSLIISGLFMPRNLIIHETCMFFCSHYLVIDIDTSSLYRLKPTRELTAHFERLYLRENLHIRNTHPRFVYLTWVAAPLNQRYCRVHVRPKTLSARILYAKTLLSIAIVGDTDRSDMSANSIVSKYFLSTIFLR